MQPKRTSQSEDVTVAVGFNPPFAKAGNKTVAERRMERRRRAEPGHQPSPRNVFPLGEVQPTKEGK
jgi:hypothetical protein